MGWSHLLVAIASAAITAAAQFLAGKIGSKGSTPKS
jgi:hypothetical protein